MHSKFTSFLFLVFVNELLLWYWFEMLPSIHQYRRCRPFSHFIFQHVLMCERYEWKPINKWRSTSCFHVSNYTANLTVTADRAQCVGVTWRPTHVWFQFSEWRRYVGYRKDINNGQNNVTRPWKCDSMHTKTILSASSSQMFNLEKVIAFLYSSLLFSLMFLCLSVSYTRSHD